MAVLLLAHVLAVVALAVSPRLHHWVHPDADDDQHECAVALFLHGGCDQPPPPVAVPACADAWQEILPHAFPPAWVASVFSTSRVLEHAPPRAGRVSTVFASALA